MSRPFILILLLLFFGTALAKERPPNFIIIFVDDMGYGDVGAYGGHRMTTPFLDRMADEGMRFTDFHVTSAVCSPSRASLLTGMYPQRTGVSFVIDPRTPSTERGLRLDLPTIAEILKEQGYATACIGKWHLGHQPEFLPTARGFDTFFGIPVSNDMPMPLELPFADDAVVHFGSSELPAKMTEPGLVPLMRDEAIVEFPIEQDTMTRRFTEKSLQFIEKHKDQPFFLYLPHPMPHVPLAASEPFRGRNERGLYGDVIEELDWSVGQILKTLEQHKLAERTLVLFTSDNGPWLRMGKYGGSAGVLRGGKAEPYEGGHRVPAIFWMPGRVPGGAVCDELVTSMDLLPTLVCLAGGEPPANLDGHDISSIIFGAPDATSPYTAVFIEGSVRKGPWKLVRLRDGTEELYNLDEDLGEQHDLAMQMPERVRRLRPLLPEDLARPSSLPISEVLRFESEQRQPDKF